jgi:ArsR family transcriptional regulator, zinc-responsive transcriptional repressor
MQVDWPVRSRESGSAAPRSVWVARASGVREHRALYKQMGMCLYVMVSAGTKAYEAAGELLKVLSAPARLAIVAELSEQPRFVHELVERLGMSQPLVSQHLRVLRGAGLVGVERHGKGATYSLADQHVAHIVADAVQHSKEGR